MKKVYLFLAPGFEETEAIGCIDVLRRGGLDVMLVSVMGDSSVESAHHVTIQTDITLNDVDLEQAEALVLPGGMPGAEHLKNTQQLRDMIQTFYGRGGLIVAICAAPMVFGDMGLLAGKRVTCYPGFEKFLTGAHAVADSVVTDGNIITAKGPAFAYDYGLAILAKLRGDATAKEVASGMLLC